MKRSQRGFTLIELLVVISIVSILSALGLQSFHVFRARGAYGVVQDTAHKALVALEASLNIPDIDLPFVPLVTQSIPGPMANAAAREVLATFQVPKSVSVQFMHDPACNIAACTADFIQINHCIGESYTTYTRFGDGVDITLDIAGFGC